MNSRTRATLAGLALAAIGSTTAFGIVATGADFAPTPEDEQATHQRSGAHLAAVDTTPDYAVALFGITASGVD